MTMVSDTGADTDDVIDVRSGEDLDWSSLERYLRRRLKIPAAAMRVRQFSGGRANLTYLLQFGDTRLVLRRPPKGTIAPGAHDMRREATVLGHLPDAYPRAPRLLAYEDSPAVIGAEFLLIEYRDGVVIREDFPSSLATGADAVRLTNRALIDAAADLHIIDAAPIGLGELGHPDGYGHRQVAGWADRWRRAAEGAGDARMSEIAEVLAATVPVPQRVSVIHNDLKLDNCQFRAGEPETVTSVFDWDMATLGDPLFDVGLILNSMQTSSAWVLSTEDATHRYADRTGLDVSSIDWYLAFAAWRTAVVIQQLANRFKAGDSSDSRLAELTAHIPTAAARARALLP